MAAKRVQLIDRDLDALRHIARNLRERDREELFATRWDEDPETLALDTYNCGDFQWIATLDGEPVAVVGAAPAWPGFWTVFAYGTDKWPKVLVTLTRHVRRFIYPALWNSGARRVQCHALSTHEDARKWLTFLGAREEAVLDNFGKNGETFIQYLWDRGDVQGQ